MRQLDHSPNRQHRHAMKATLPRSSVVRRAKPSRLRMTKRLAEERAVGDAKAPKFDGVEFLRSLRK